MRLPLLLNFKIMKETTKMVTQYYSYVLLPKAEGNPHHIFVNGRAMVSAL